MTEVAPHLLLPQRALRIERQLLRVDGIEDLAHLLFAEVARTGLLERDSGVVSAAPSVSRPAPARMSDVTGSLAT